MIDLPLSSLDFRAGTTMAAAALAALGIPQASLRRRALSGALLLGLALASVDHLGGPDAAVPAASRAITLGLALLGLLLLSGSLIAGLSREGWTRTVRWRSRVSGMAAVVLGGGLVIPAGPEQGWPMALATTLGLGLGGAAAGLLGRKLRLAGGVRWLDQALSAPGSRARPGMGWDRGSRRLALLHVLGTLTALGALHLHPLLGGAAIAAAAGVMLDRRLGRLRRWPVSAFLAMVGLVVAWYLLARVAEGMPLGLLALRDAPYSQALENLAALLLAIAAWSLLQLWPFHTTPRGPLTALVGGCLLVRLVSPVLPHGLFHWQPLLYPLAVLAAWHAAATDRDGEAVTAFGALGLLSGTGPAGWAGLGLTAGGVVLGLTGRLAEHGMAVNWRGRLVQQVAVVAGTVLAVPVLSGALATQVFYTVAATGGIVAALWSRDGAAGRQRRTAA
jgi:hypothetical protein